MSSDAAPAGLSPHSATFLAAVLFAVDPVGLGGVALRSAAGPARERWLGGLAGLLPAGTPWRRVPLNISDDRLLGGLDLAATLQAGRPIAQRGLLADADGGVVLLAMAERIGASAAASIAAVIDTRELVAERHGIGTRSASRLGVIALDEGDGDDERLPARLRERLAFHLVLGRVVPSASLSAPSRSSPTPSPSALSTAPTRAADDAGANDLPFTRDDVLAARARFARVRIDDRVVETLCGTALALGIGSSRAAVFACRAARACAALDRRDEVNDQDAAWAAALVLAPRATQLPAAAAPTGAPDESDETDETDETDRTDGNEADRHSQATTEPATDALPLSAATNDAGPPPAAGHDGETERLPLPSSAPDTRPGRVDDLVLEAALAAIPPGLLAMLALANGTGARVPRTPSAHGAGASRIGRSRGCPTGARRGEPRGGARLNLIDTLRAAAPWQTLRRREAEAAGQTNAPRIQVRREDFHVWRFKQRSETTTVFVVDASGSSAVSRLAEAKGAVELLLSDCYVRRDSVAVIAFRGARAEVLLPPTRSLVRAKRSLAGLPGGGGTPLAAGLDAARTLAEAVRRRGATPVVVLLTDGRANIARDGTPGRARAGDDALVAARAMRIEGFASLLIDTSPQPQATARDLAAAMGARYLPLPYAGASLLSQAVRATVGGGVAGAAPSAAR